MIHMERYKGVGWGCSVTGEDNRTSLLNLNYLKVAQSHKISMILCGPKGIGHLVMGLVWLKTVFS